MAILDQKIQSKIDGLSNSAYEEFEAGKKEASFKLLKEAWELYPEPKNNWNEAYNTAKYIFLDYMKLKRYNDAKEWLNKMIEVNNNLHLFNEDCLFSIGKYQFDTGKEKEAFETFDKVVKSAGMRYFQDEEARYLKFYKAALKTT